MQNLLTAKETNSIIAQRNEVCYYPTKAKAAAGVETLRAFEVAHGRPNSEFSVGKNGRQHFVFIKRVDVA